MSISIPHDARSICWSCKYYDWAIELREGGKSDWVNVCNSPAEYVAGDDVKICGGYKNGNPTEQATANTNWTAQ